MFVEIILLAGLQGKRIAVFAESAEYGNGSFVMMNKDSKLN